MVKNRYEAELKRCISEIVISELSDPRVGWVTIADVQLSKDWRQARVLVCVVGDEQASMEALQGASGFIRSSLSKRLPWRHVPKLRFELYRQEWVL